MSKDKNKQKIIEAVETLEEIISAITDKQKEFNPDMRDYDRGLLMGKLEALKSMHAILKYDDIFFAYKLSI